MNRIARCYAAVLALDAAVAVCAHDYTAGALKIGHPWARPTVAGQGVVFGAIAIVLGSLALVWIGLRRRRLGSP